jgi:hypothetical protein
MSLQEIEPNLIVKVPIKSIETPRRGTCEVFLDYWWIVDPEKDAVIFYKRWKPGHSSPQFNGNKPVAEKILGRLWAPFGFEIRQVPVAFLPVWTTGDFGYQLERLLGDE